MEDVAVKKLKKKTKTNAGKGSVSLKKNTKDLPDTPAERKEYKKYCLSKFEEFNNNGKITVAIMCDTFFPIVDGVIMVMDNYAKRLQKMCNVVMIVPEHMGKTYKKDYLVVGVRSIFIKFVNYDLAFPSLDNDLKQLLRKLRIDIIHLHSPFLVGSYAVSLAKKRKIPIVSTFHSQYKQDFYKNTNSKMITDMLVKGVAKIFNNSTEAWTMSEASLNTLASYGFKGKSFLIPNATDFVRLDGIDKYVSEVDKKYKLKDAENVFLFVGRLIEAKNILFIVDVLAELKKMGLNFKMVFVGNGPDEDKLKAKIRETGLENEVVLTGKITDKKVLSAFYERADLFLFPSLYDVSSIVQIEAACFNLPVVFAEGAVTACAVNDGVNGFIEKPEVEAFSKRVFNILSDKKTLKKVGEKAHKDLYIHWDQVVGRAFERYNYLIENNRKKLDGTDGK